MKDRHHDDAMAEVYRNDPELAASPRPLTPAEIESLRQDMSQAIEWARAELARRRNQ